MGAAGTGVINTEQAVIDQLTKFSSASGTTCSGAIPTTTLGPSKKLLTHSAILQFLRLWSPQVEYRLPLVRLRLLGLLVVGNTITRQARLL